MIELTRLRHDDTFLLNPDLIERVDTHVDTVVRLTSGTEYVVVESGEEIRRRIAVFRAQVLALVPVVADHARMTADEPGGLHAALAIEGPSDMIAEGAER